MGEDDGFLNSRSKAVMVFTRAKVSTLTWFVAKSIKGQAKETNQSLSMKSNILTLNAEPVEGNTNPELKTKPMKETF